MRPFFYAGNNPGPSFWDNAYFRTAVPYGSTFLLYGGRIEYGYEEYGYGYEYEYGNNSYPNDNGYEYDYADSTTGTVHKYIPSNDTWELMSDSLSIARQTPAAMLVHLDMFPSCTTSGNT